MTTEVAWPPRSPHAALLSSPSGRRKFLHHRSNKENLTSPTKGPATSPHLRHIAGSSVGSDEDGQDEDEETLQLKLAAIEAKLKLKKLQQSKAKSQNNGVEGEERCQPKPTSMSSAYPSVSCRSYASSSRVEVPLSPKKQQIPPHEQRSPGRVLLGIDKGITGADVSLRRARTVHGSPINKRLNKTGDQSRSTSRLSTFGSTRSTVLNLSNVTTGTKTFSERMAEARDTDQARERKRDEASRLRGPGLKVNEAELESYRLAAEEAGKINPPKSLSRQRLQTTFSRDGGLQPSHKALKKSRTLPDLRQSMSTPTDQRNTFGEDLASNSAQVDATLYEPFSHLNLSSRILPESFLKRTLPSETFTCMRVPDLLRQVTSPAYELPESVIDFALFGVIASKSSPMDHKTASSEERSKGDNDWEKEWEDGSQNQRKFMVLTITDLKWTVELYLFGTAVPRYHRLSLGTVVSIINPSIMPPKKGREDTGTFSLTLNRSDDTVLEIGTSCDLGFCNAVKKDGKQCGSWVNSSKTEICEFHLNLQVSKAQSGRMGLNTGSNGFGGGTENGSRNKYNIFAAGSRREGAGERRGLLPRKDGPRYDPFTGSQFYISSSSAGTNARGSGAPIYRPERSTAHMLDQDDDDPFVAEGQFSRDKEGRLRKRLETHAKEREIAEKLVAMSSGGAGGEYLRHRSEKKDGKTSTESGSQRSAMVNRNTILAAGGGANGNGKRTADSVRLSPVKKTRFVTDRGIKIAGRESLGHKAKHDDDDDLDIV